MKYFAWMVFILPFLYSSPALAQDAPPNLTGSWVLNQKLSDDFSEIMQEARGEGPGRQEGGGGGGGGRGGGGGGGRGGRGGGGGDGGGGDKNDRQAKAQERLEHASQAHSRLEIFHENLELNVTDGVDITRLLYTDGREMDIWTQQGEARAKANWRDRTLVVEWKIRGDEVNRTRYYTLSEEGPRLTVKESFLPPGQDKAIDMTLVYDLEE